MSHVLIIGGGFSGCTVAYELAVVSGMKVTIVEKSAGIGGKVRNYGCKATDKCNNCGVCLAAGLWEKVEKDRNVCILNNSKLVDVTGKAGDFSAIVKTQDGKKYINGISSIVVATGFEESPVCGHLQLEGKQGIIRGLELEKICKGRSGKALFEKAPDSIAFVQCVGSRDKKEDSTYCSRVCCSYSTRAAKVIRQTYPECRIAFFYMEMQAVSGGDYFLEMKEKYDVEFIKCRPLRIKGGEPALIEYEDPESGKLEQRAFEIICLSDGIHPPRDVDITAELCGLSQDKYGFLKDGNDGIYVAGCAKKPAKIEETWSDSAAVSEQVRREVWRQV